MRGYFQSLPRLIQLKPIQFKSIAAPVVVGCCVVGLIGSSAMAQSAGTAKRNAPTRGMGQDSATKPLLKSGSQGAAVTELQAMLKLMSYYDGSVSGVYDEATAAAVTRFQKAANLSADGVVGLDTWNRLLPPAPDVVAASTTSPNPSAMSGATEAFPVPGGVAKPNSTPAQKPATVPPQKPATTAATTSGTGSDRAQANSQDATLPILRLGMKGTAVEGLQERLRSLGYLKSSADGVFGADTQAAVKAAQRNLKLEPDGIVGSSTWLGLLR